VLTAIQVYTANTATQLINDASAVSYLRDKFKKQDRRRHMLTAKPMVCPCVKHEMEGLRLSGEAKDC
jgi:hypothetical protein